MVENLIDNAVGHNQPGGWVRVATAVEDQPGAARRRERRAGPRPRRGQAAHPAVPAHRRRANRIGRGAGLGLAIVSSIVEAHGGTLELEALTDGGLRVAITLPLAVGTAAGAPA